MKTLLLAFLLMALSLTTLQGSAQDNPLFRHLPPDATSIYQVNIPVLAAKLPWQELAQKMAAAPKVKSDRMMNLMVNPFLTGIDITKDVFIAETDKGNPDSATYTTILVHLADSAKFVAFMIKQEPGLRFFSYPNKGRAAGKDKYGAAWDKDIAIVTIVKPGAGDPMPPPPPKGKTAPAAPKRPVPNYAVLAAKKSFAALRGFDGSVYTTDPVFKAGFSDDADIHMWAPQGTGISKLTKGLLRRSPMGNQGLTKVMAMRRSNMHTLTTLRFEAGKITLKSSTLYPPDSLAFYTKFSSKPLNTSLVTSLPKGKLLGMVNLHFDPSAINEMLELSHSRAKLDSMLASKDLTTDNIIHAFKGDILLAAVNPDDKPADSSSAKSKQPSIYIATTIDDLPSFMKLAGKMNLMKDPAAGSKMAGDSAAADAGPTLMDKAKMSYTLKDNILVISTSKAMADAWFSNTEKRSTDFIPALVRDNPFSLLVDLQTVRSFLQAMGNGEPSEKDKQIFRIFGSLDTFTLAGGALRDGRVQTTIELKLTDSSENSLKALVKMIP